MRFLSFMTMGNDIAMPVGVENSKNTGNFSLRDFFFLCVAAQYSMSPGPTASLVGWAGEVCCASRDSIFFFVVD